MNWYDKIQLFEHIHKMFRISNIGTRRTTSKNIVKTASLGPSLSAQLDWKSQSEDSLEFGNFQRYVCDSQTIKIFMTKTADKYAISLITNHTYLGTAGWSIFWSFGLDEKKEAEKTFKEVSKIASEFNNSVVKTIIAEEKIQNKNRIMRFLLGGDKESVKLMMQEVNQNKEKIKQLRQLMEECDCDKEIKDMLKEQIINIETEKNRLEMLAKIEEEYKGLFDRLFGWLF